MSHPPPDLIEALLAAAYAEGRLTPNEVAEAAWLIARFIPPITPADSTATTAPAEPDQRPAPPTATHVPDALTASKRATPAQARQAPAPSPHGTFLTGGTQQTAAPAHPPSADPVLAYDELAQALRPLRRQVRRPGAGRLDEEATVQRSAEARRLLPVETPPTERWLELALVVDTSSSMTLWRPAVRELQDLLRTRNAFRDLRIWHLDGDLGSPVLHTGDDGSRTGPGHRASELTDPTRRRLIVVVTDGVGRLWQHDAMAAVLLEWFAASPLVLVNVLPERLWHRTGLPVVPVSARSAPPRSGMLVLHPRRFPARPRRPRQGLVPLIALDPGRISAWVAAMSGARAGWTPTTAVALPRPHAEDHTPADLPSTAAELVQRFRLTASPSAFRLACHLAAAPLTLPVMRLIQRHLVPDATLADLAELFLSGLLIRRSADSADDPDSVIYDFTDDPSGPSTVRQELLANLPRSDAYQVLEVLSRSPDGVAVALGGSLDFRTFLGGSGGPNVHPPESRAFAEVAVAVLQSLGGDYEELAADIVGASAAPADRHLSSRRPSAATIVSSYGSDTLVVGYRDGRLRTFDLASGTYLRDLTSSPTGHVVCLAAVPLAGQVLCLAVWSDGVVELWDAGTGERSGQGGRAGAELAAAACGQHEGDAVAVTADAGGTLLTWTLRPEGPAIVGRLASAGLVRTLDVLTSDGRATAVVVGADGTLKAYPLPIRWVADVVPARREQNEGGTGSRRAVCIGIEHFARARDDESAFGYQSLPGARTKVQAVAAALSRFGYDCTIVTDPVQSGAADIADQIWRAAEEIGPDGTLVVHVLSHGYVGHTGALYVIGVDGQRHPLNEVSMWLRRIADSTGAPRTLFLLDLSHAGTAARHSSHLLTADGAPRAWVIAASGPDEVAFSGRFSAAVANVLDQLADGALDVDVTLPYIPLELVARSIRREVDRLVVEAHGLPQTIMSSRVDLTSEPLELPFFPNPRFVSTAENRLARSRVDAALAPFLSDVDEALDPAFFIDRAAGHQSQRHGSFTGRNNELRTLSAWFEGSDEVPFRVVTGRPGVGKSALLGIVVCAAYPELRAHTLRLWQHLAQVPSPLPIGQLAAVYARQRTPEQIVASLGRQLRLVPRTGDQWRLDDLRQQLLARPQPSVIVLDALDEAERPLEVMRQVVLPLTELRRSDGTAAVRLLVAVRPWPEFAPLLRLAEEHHGLIDLDQVPAETLRRDLDTYVDNLLRDQPPYDQMRYAAARRAFAAALSETLTSMMLSEVGDIRWGDFLIAGHYTSYVLRTHEPLPDVDEAVRLGRMVPVTLGEFLELEFATQTMQRWLRPVSAAIAHAHGDGMPLETIRIAALAFAGKASEPPTHAEVTAAVDALRSYLRLAADVDGSSLYRMAHQGIADYLRLHPHSAAVEPEDPSVLFNALLRPIGSGRGWDLAEPYLLRHAMDHAVSAGLADTLWQDVDYVVCADPQAILANIHQPVRSADARAVVEACRSISGWAAMDVGQRVGALWTALSTTHPASAVVRRLERLSEQHRPQPGIDTAVTYQYPQSVIAAAALLGPGAPTVAAAGRDGSIGLLGSSGELRAVGTAHEQLSIVRSTLVAGRVVVLAAGTSGTLRIWDAGDLQQLHILVGDGAPVEVLVVGEFADVPVAVTVTAEGSARAWDLTSGLVVRTFHVP